MYFNDSGKQILWRYNFDVETGNISNKSKLIDGIPGTTRDVLNDGMVIEFVPPSSPLNISPNTSAAKKETSGSQCGWATA